MNLAVQQQAFIAALRFATHENALDHLAQSGALERDARWRRGVLAYRTNADALAERALAGAYPVVAQLLGEANFSGLARELWRREPPRRGDVAQWGEALPAFIAAMPQLAHEEPYLADVARVEWQLHAAASVADREADLASLALLTQADPAQVALDLAPATALVASAYPVASIVLAHLEGAPSFEHAGERLQAGVAETAVVWRRGLKPCVRIAIEGEARFIGALQEGRTLADSLETAGDLDVAAWLPLAVETGLLLGARRP